MIMYYKIKETDEALSDLSSIAFEAFNYTGDINSGQRFIHLYDLTAANIAMFPNGFSSTEIEYRGYKIHILPFGNYNLFYIVDSESMVVTVLRILYQKQNWRQVIKVDDTYHINGYSA